MKQKIKQIVIMVIVLLLGLTLLTPLFAMSDTEYNKFSENEDQYQKLCSSYSPDDRDTCESFSEFKKEKIKRAKEDVKSAKSSISEIKGQIGEEENKLESYHKQIQELEVDIIANEKLVTQTEGSIRTVEKQIKDREDRIEELDLLIKSFLVNMQGEMRVNGYIEFIMGASDFSDIVRRGEGMKRIKEYNEALISEVLEEQALLEADKKNLVSKKEQLVNEKELLVVQVEKSKTLYSVIDAIVKELRVQKKTQENLVEQSTRISDSEEAKWKDIFEQAPPPPPPVVTPPVGVPDAVPGETPNIPNVPNVPNAPNAPDAPDAPSAPSVPSAPTTSGGHASSGWIYPVSGNFRVGNGVWSYDSGGKHLGQDYPASIGTTLVAPANGVVVRTSDVGCGDNYNISDRCNGGWGNYLNMIVNVDGNYYGLLYAHITPGGMLSSSGQKVSAGQAVAKMGSSGQSSGPHLHVEVYYIGKDTNTAFSNYTTNTFGTGGSTSERGNSRCQSNGNNAPCRVNPRSVFP